MKKKIIIFSTVSLLLTPIVAGAQIADYINNLYTTAIGLSGLLAVIMIAAGATYLTVSGGSPDKQKEGKSYITSAILGILLLLGAFVLLNTINPQLTDLQDPDPNLNVGAGGGIGGPTVTGGGGVNINDLTRSSNNNERRVAYCNNDADSENFNQEYANCIARNSGNNTITSENTKNMIVNCKVGFTTYSCWSSIETKLQEVDPDEVGEDIQWSYYYTEQGRSLVGSSGYIEPDAVCAVSSIGSEEIEEIEDDHLAICPM